MFWLLRSRMIDMCNCSYLVSIGFLMSLNVESVVRVSLCLLISIASSLCTVGSPVHMRCVESHTIDYPESEKQFIGLCMNVICILKVVYLYGCVYAFVCEYRYTCMFIIHRYVSISSSIDLSMHSCLHACCDNYP